MFKPKMYKSNGLEAYHLINDEGGDFLYEGKVEYSEGELFKDEQGRTFYLLTTEIGGPSKYYVEVEPEGKPIPIATKEKTISDLVMASPKWEKPLEEVKKIPTPEPVPEPVKVAEPEKQPDTCFESPEKPTLAPDIPVEPPATKPSTTDEAQAAVMAMAALGKPKKRKIFSIPVIVGLIVLLLVIAAAGIYIYKPGLVSGLHIPFISKTTPTPAPTATPTPTPTPAPTATPNPTGNTLPGGPDIYRNLLALAPAIDSDNASVVSYAANNSNLTGTSFSQFARVCDLFDIVNKNWMETSSATAQNASDSAQTLSGSVMDYSVFMAALANAEGMDSRVVAVYNEDLNSYVYYPEVKVATNDNDYNDALVYIRARYNVSDPYGQADGREHWLSLSMGKTPGVKVDSKYAYAVNSKNEVSPV